MAGATKKTRFLDDDELLAEIDALSDNDVSNSDSESESFGSESESESCAEGIGDGDENDPHQDAAQRTKRRRTSSPLFQWQRGNFVPQVHDFDNQNSGISTNFDENCTVFDIFKLFFSFQIMQHLAEQTNRYYKFLCQKLPPTPHSRLQSWVETTAEELYIFLGLAMLMARVKKLSLAEYWTKDPLISTPQFSKYMSSDRYILLLRLLHFNDNDTQTQGDRLHKLKPIVDHLRNTFKSIFTPFQNLCIDESLVLFKGRLLFKQYIPSKRHRFGIKVFVLCDCETGYILDFILYMGATTDIVEDRELGISGAVLQTLMTTYVNKGHNLWIDNWYLSPLLFNWIHTNGVNVCGTVRKNRREMPKMTEKLKKGQVECRHTGNMLALRWMDRREVCMLTTLHTGTMRQTERQTHQ
jgi:hypothetical protein